MAEPDGAKELPESIFADDDGTADARLAQALIRHSSGRAPLTDVVEALAFARVLVPVVASGELRHVGEHGLEKDAVASTGVVAVHMPDGRRALPIFTDVDAMRAWKGEARPVPAEGPRAALSAVQEQWAAMILNPGMESTVIPRPAVWALAQGQEWLPAVRDGRVSTEVRDAIADVVTLDHEVVSVEARPGDGAEVAVVLHLVAGLGTRELEDIVSRVQTELSRSALLASRVDSLELRLQPELPLDG